ncbi:hypothetical protein L1887_40696 [Cichorium endivia]|nr:hypothetical protein L1887_40696 [Cichorium endivia]
MFAKICLNALTLCFLTTKHILYINPHKPTKPTIQLNLTHPPPSSNPEHQSKLFLAADTGRSQAFLNQ